MVTGIQFRFLSRFCAQHVVDWVIANTVFTANVALVTAAAKADVTLAWGLADAGSAAGQVIIIAAWGLCLGNMCVLPAMEAAVAEPVEARLILLAEPAEAQAAADIVMAFIPVLFAADRDIFTKQEARLAMR